MLNINIRKLCMFLQQKTTIKKWNIQRRQFKSVSKDIYNDTIFLYLK